MLKRTPPSARRPAPSAEPGGLVVPSSIKATVEAARSRFYSGAEWAEINAAVVAVRGIPLSVSESASLLEAAWEYKGGHAQRTWRRNYIKQCTKVAHLCAQLREALEPMDGRFALRLDRAKGRVTTSFRDMAEVLAELGAQADAIATNPSSWRRSKLRSYTGRQDPPVVYYQHVLWLWTDIFGGKLTFHRNAESKPTGKLARYFFAVTRPVMGGEAPSPASLPDIIDRQKAFYQWLDETRGDERANIALTYLIVKMLKRAFPEFAGKQPASSAYTLPGVRKSKLNIVGTS
jgi:hypothetical protein